MAKKAANPIDKHVGSRVRMRRKALKMSQSALGDKLGLTFQQIQKYELGTNRMGASRLQAMSNILQVPVSFFFEGAPPEPQTARYSKAGAQPPDYGTAFLSSTHGSNIEQALRDVTDPAMLDVVVAVAEKVGAAAKNKVVKFDAARRRARG